MDNPDRQSTIRNKNLNVIGLIGRVKFINHSNQKVNGNQKPLLDTHSLNGQQAKEIAKQLKKMTQRCI
jgi:hypothetical protein